MTDSPLRNPEPSRAGTWLMRGLPSPTRSADPPETGSPDAVPDLDTAQTGPDVGARARRDWSASLDLIHEATAAIRISEERASELEDELERTLAQSRAREAALEAQIALAQQRAEAAEQRAAEAEEWLARMHDAVVEGFTRREPPKAASSPATSAA